MDSTLYRQKKNTKCSLYHHLFWKVNQGLLNQMNIISIHSITYIFTMNHDQSSLTSIYIFPGCVKPDPVPLSEYATPDTLNPLWCKKLGSFLFLGGGGSFSQK